MRGALPVRGVSRLVLLGAVLATPVLGQSDSEAIFERERALASAIEQANPKALEALLTRDVRVVRSDDTTFTEKNVEIRLNSLFGLSPGARVSRSAETIQISQSGDYAFITGTETVSSAIGKSATRRYLAIWRRIPEFEKTWSLAFDAPLENWQGLDASLSLDAVWHTPGLMVVNLRPSHLAQQLEPASFRQSKAKDLAYSIGSYYVPLPPETPDASPKWGHYLATWEDDGSGWKLLHASFPEPTGTHVP
jgi:ketosteroid isomerase-like protein